MNNYSNSTRTQQAATCILLSVADVDEKLADEELQIIDEILQDFFMIDKSSANYLIIKAQDEWKNSPGLFQFGNQLNDDFNHDDKMDFICCIFEVAYADGELHYLEHHTV